MTDEPTSTRGRIISAALDLIAERGVRGATTRRIAERARVNEVTLFRHFDTKSNLIFEALGTVAESFADLGTGALDEDDLKKALTTLARNYSGAVREHFGALIRLIPQARVDDDVRAAVAPTMQKTAARLVAFFESQQRAGHLRADAPPQALAVDFMGPLLARGLTGGLLGLDDGFEPEAYVERYLDGHGG
jgi:AcrR family transcriptional regulator